MRTDWEAVVGGTWLNWVGIAILVFGVAFLVRWIWLTFKIPPPVTITLLHLLGGGFIAWAYLTMRKTPEFALGIFGLGIFTLYTTVFAATWYYELFPPPVAYVECLGISLFAAAVSVYYDRVLAVIVGALGGYVTPIVSMAEFTPRFTIVESVDPLGLHIYLACLNAALLGSADWKAWHPLKPVTFAATVVMTMPWLYGSPSTFTICFIIALQGLIFAASTAGRSLAGLRHDDPTDVPLFVANSVWCLFASMVVVFRLGSNEHLNDKISVVLAIFLICHLALSISFKTMAPESPRFYWICKYFSSVFSFALIPAVFYHSPEMIIPAWSCLASLHYALGLYFRDSGLQLAAFGILCAISAVFVSDISTGFKFTSGLDRRWLTLTLSGVVLIVSGCLPWMLGRLEEWRTEELVRFISVSFVATGNTIMMLAMERQWDGYAVTVLWTLNVAQWWLVGFYLDWYQLRGICVVLSLTLLGRLTAALIDTPIEDFHLFVNSRFIAIFTLSMQYFGATWAYRQMRLERDLFGVTKSYTRRPRADDFPVEHVMVVLANIMLQLGISLDVHSWFGSDTFTTSEYVTYSIVWTMHASILIAAGFVLRYPLLRVIGLIAIVPIVGKVFLLDMGTLPIEYKVLGFTVVGGLLVAVSYIYQRNRSRMKES